jgi:hypothetical protein
LGALALMLFAPHLIHRKAHPARLLHCAFASPFSSSRWIAGGVNCLN